MHLAIEIGIGVAYIAALGGMWLWSRKHLDLRSELTRELEKAGFNEVRISHMDSEDWRCATGEASLDGRRVRFGTILRPEGNIGVLATAVGSSDRWEKTLGARL